MISGNKVKGRQIPGSEVRYADHRKHTNGGRFTSSRQNARTFNNAWNHYWYWFCYSDHDSQLFIDDIHCGSFQEMGANNITVGVKQSSEQEQVSANGMRFGTSGKSADLEEDDRITDEMIEGLQKQYSDKLMRLH